MIKIGSSPTAFTHVVPMGRDPGILFWQTSPTEDGFFGNSWHCFPKREAGSQIVKQAGKAGLSSSGRNATDPSEIGHVPSSVRLPKTTLFLHR